MSTSTGQHLAIGERAPEFSDLPATDGHRYSLSSFDDSEVVVLVFLGNGCPTAKSCEAALMTLQEAYRQEGVRLVAFNPNNASLSPPDTFMEMSKRAQAKGFNFPYLKDAQGSLARALGVTRTPQVCVLDGGRRLRYRGRVFDARDPARVQRHDLREAVQDILARRDVRVPESQAFGCSIVW